MNTLRLVRLNRVAFTRGKPLYTRQLCRQFHKEQTAKELNNQPSPSIIDKARAISKELGAQFSTGFKVLYANTKKTFGEYKEKIKKQEPLSRAELRFIDKTREDLLCLIPFGTFAMLPGSTALLPIFIQLYPHLLPSTFHTQAVRDKNFEKLKISTTSGLQKSYYTLVFKLVEMQNSTVYSSKEKELVNEFYNKLYIGDANELQKFSPVFHETAPLSISQLSRQDVVGLCEYLGLLSFFPTGMLKQKLVTWVYKTIVDDWAIRKEGIDSLSDNEVVSACTDRRLIFKVSDKSNIKQCRDILSKYLSTVPRLTVPSSLKIPSVPAYICKQVNTNEEGKQGDPSSYLWSAVLLQTPQINHQQNANK